MLDSVLIAYAANAESAAAYITERLDCERTPTGAADARAIALFAKLRPLLKSHGGDAPALRIAARAQGLADVLDVALSLPTWFVEGSGTVPALVATFNAGKGTQCRPPGFAHAMDCEESDEKSDPILSLREWRSHPALWTPPTPLVPNLLYPGTVTLISAREKMGKTSFVAQMAAALSVGGLFLGAQLPRCRVLWYANDEPLDLALQRFDRLGAGDDLLVTRARLGSAKDFRRDLSAHLPEVVVLDSLGDLWEGRVDSNSHDETRAFLKPFIREARDVNAAFVPIYHTNANATKYAGAVAIGAMVDAPLLLKPRGQVTGDDGEDVADDGRRLLEGRTRYGVVRIPLAFRDGLYQRGDDPLPLEHRVLRVLCDDPQSQNALRGALNVRKEALGQVVREHVAAHRLERAGNRLVVTQEGHAFLAGTRGNQRGTAGNHSGTEAIREAVPAGQPRGDSGNRLDDGEELIA
jgi:hypothetical protein